MFLARRKKEEEKKTKTNEIFNLKSFKSHFSVKISKYISLARCYVTASAEHECVFVRKMLSIVAGTQYLQTLLCFERTEMLQSLPAFGFHKILPVGTELAPDTNNFQQLVGGVKFSLMWDQIWCWLDHLSSLGSSDWELPSGDFLGIKAGVVLCLASGEAQSCKKLVLHF